MPDFEIICLANSRKHSGRCIAGLKIDGSGWLRPVTNDGPLNRRHYVLDNNTETLVLDTLNINLTKPVPKTYQPENWLIGKLPWHLAARPAPQKYIRLIRRFVETGPQLFGNTHDRVPLNIITERPVLASLVLISPKDIRWHITTSITGKRQIRARFDLSGAQYSLVVTDPQWEYRLIALNEGIYSSERVGIEKNDGIFLTISLGGPLHGECFKLVAAVIVL